MKIYTLILFAFTIFGLSGCISEGSSQSQERKILDGSYEERPMNQDNNWTTYHELDSAIQINTKCDLTKNERHTVIELTLGNEVTEGEQARRILEIVTDPKTGKVIRVHSREGKYREKLHHFGEKFSYTLQLDSCSIDSTNIGFYGW